MLLFYCKRKHLLAFQRAVKLTMSSSKIIFSLIILVHILITFIINTSKTAKFPETILVFGDSLVDSGNNNYIKTSFKADFFPYGQDFPGKVPTGRFTNGKLVTDFLASMLGIKEIVPPFLDPNLSEDELVTGVSFASAGSGFDDLTTFGTRVVSVCDQIELFKEYAVRLKGIVGEEKAKKMIGSALVIISAGTNDFAFNFYGIPTRRLEFNISGYQDFLLERLQSFVKEIYELGCRKIIVAGLPRVCCLPLQMTIKFEILFHRKCLEDQNLDAQSYNHKLVKLLPHLQSLLPRSLIVYADIYQPFIDMLDHPKKYGFVETKRGCCGSGLLEAGFLCNPLTPICGRPSEFIFWDSIHPTQSVYQYLAKYIEVEILSKLL